MKFSLVIGVDKMSRYQKYHKCPVIVEGCVTQNQGQEQVSRLYIKCTQQVVIRFLSFNLFFTLHNFHITETLIFLDLILRCTLRRITIGTRLIRGVSIVPRRSANKYLKQSDVYVSFTTQTDQIRYSTVGAVGLEFRQVGI